MKKMSPAEYYASKQDYYLDNENVADCKYQVELDDETTLYAIAPDSDQFFVAKIGAEDIFYCESIARNFVKNYKN